jgi:hypothetical protein
MKESKRLNWANVHKRLIPQLIRKGVIYSQSELVQKGLYFIVPEIVYQKFEDIIGNIPTLEYGGPDTLTVFTYTVFTYELGGEVEQGSIRELKPAREIRFLLSEFARRFIEGANLPSGAELDEAVRGMLGLR